LAGNWELETGHWLLQESTAAKLTAGSRKRILLMMNDTSLTQLARFVAQMAMLQQAIKRDATREQVLARISLLEADAAQLVEALERDDPRLAEAVRDAWQDPARAISKK
jgi:hypothetical protein